MKKADSPSPAKSLKTETGRAGEAAAAEYLAQAGIVPERRNWRCRFGEIDLIARDGDTLVFVEVRSRTNPTRFGTAIEAVTPRKCRQVREVAAVYLKQREVAPAAVRFDVVAVTFGSGGGVREIRHLPGAF
jgi:putative endonuclease